MLKNGLNLNVESSNNNNLVIVNSQLTGVFVIKRNEIVFLILLIVGLLVNRTLCYPKPHKELQN